MEAHATVDALVKNKAEQPLALLELHYQYAGTYHPLITCVSGLHLAKQLSKEKYVFMFGNEYGSSVELDNRSFERLFAQFRQIMEDQDDPGIGRRLLNKVARLLNQHKLFGKITVTDDFGAYAIDWSIDGHDYAGAIAIFKDCGIEATTLETWKQRGMFVSWPDAV